MLMVLRYADGAVESLFFSIRALQVRAKELSKLFVGAVTILHELEAEELCRR